jgi:toxin YoeB
MYQVFYSDEANNDIAFFKKNSSQDYKKCSIFIEEISINPRKGTGHPKQLSHSLIERWSRKVNKKDRMVYRIVEDDKIVVILSCRGHYNDK